MADDTEDADVALGRKIAAGTAAAAAPGGDDPDVALGRQIVAATPPAATAPSADTSTPYDVEHSLLGISSIHNFAAGATQGVRDVMATGAGLANWVDQRFPALAGLDRFVGIDPGKAKNVLDTSRADYEASPEGQSYMGGAGRVAGNVVAIPGLGEVGGAVGAGMRGAGAAAETVAPALARVPAFVGRAVTRAAQGGVEGGLYGGATSGGSDDPVLQNMLATGKIGAVAGPALGVVGDVGGATLSGIKNYLGQFTGKTEAASIEAALADARTRSGAPPVGETGQPPPEPAPTQPGGPQAAGAQASTNVPPMAPDEALASRVAGFEQKMTAQPKAGFDNTEYVKNSTPTTAEMLADPALAQQQRVLAAGSPEMTAIDRNNNEARFIHYDNIAPGPMELNTLGKMRDTNAKANLDVAFNPATKGDADTSGTTQHIQDILDGPDGKLEPVQAAMAKVQRALQNKAGTGPETDPQQLYGVGKQINYMMSKLGGLDTPGSLDPTVKRALASTKEKLYDAIEPAAPGFAKFRSDYERDSVPINVGEMMQEYRPKLLGGNDGATMSLGPVNSMLKSIGARIASDDPTDAAKSLTEDQIDKLFNLRSDLQRQNNRYLAKPAGSNTQHDINLATQMGLHGVAGAANNLLSRIPVAGDIAANALENTARNASARNKAMLTNRLLFPQHPLVPPGGY